MTRPGNFHDTNFTIIDRRTINTCNLFMCFAGGTTLDIYEKKPDSVENGTLPPGNNVADFEQAIELTGKRARSHFVGDSAGQTFNLSCNLSRSSGYGKFHYLLLVVCGFVSTSEEMDVICMSFILPSAQCDLKLNTSSKGWLNSIIFIGECSANEVVLDQSPSIVYY